MGRKSRAGSSPASRRSAVMVGKRSSKPSSPVASRSMWSASSSSILRVMARATTSRGCSSSTNRLPSRSLMSAPCPRSASDSNGRGMRGLSSAVGWNCMNSMSAQATPARSAIARPSPVDWTGLVVAANSWPAPPVASSTWRDADLLDGRRRAPRPRRRRIVRPRPAGRARTTAPSRRPRSLGPRRPAPARSRRPSPRRRRGRCGAWEWPPSRASCSWPSRSRSNIAPMAISSLTRPGPSSTRARTASTSHRPAPAAERVGQVEIGRVRVAAQHGRHPSLGPSGGGLRQLGLGEHPHSQRQLVGGPDRGRQPGHAAAQRPAGPAPRPPATSSPGPHSVTPRAVTAGRAARRPG